MGQEIAEGARLGRFVVVRPLGAGGMGEVYEARDPDLDRSVAVKVLREKRAEDERSAIRLVREAQALAQLSHPNIVTVHEVGLADGRLFVAMEYVDGRTLDHYFASARPAWREVLAVYLQAGRGLAAAHARSIIHRDFKPANVLVDREGRVRVSDFGLARLGEGMSSLPDVGTAALSPSSEDSTEMCPTRRSPPSTARRTSCACGRRPTSWWRRAASACPA